MTWWHLVKAAGTTFRVSAPTILQARTGRLTADTCDRRLAWWSRRLLEQARIELSVQGLDNLSEGENYVVMSNHQSHYDIPVIYQALGRRLRMVAKRELFRVPLWGRAMRVAGFIEIDRQNHDRALDSMRRAAEALRAGTDIWIAPEGTRSRDGALGEFRKGGFHLALETGARILPVTIEGTRRVLPAQGRVVHPGARVIVTLHPPVDPMPYGHERIEALMDTVRGVIQRPLGCSDP